MTKSLWTLKKTSYLNSRVIRPSNEPSPPSPPPQLNPAMILLPYQNLLDVGANAYDHNSETRKQKTSTNFSSENSEAMSRTIRHCERALGKVSSGNGTCRGTRNQDFLIATTDHITSRTKRKYWRTLSLRHSLRRGLQVQGGISCMNRSSQVWPRRTVRTRMKTYYISMSR